MRKTKWKWSKTTAMDHLNSIGETEGAARLDEFKSNRNGSNQGWDGYARKHGLGKYLWP